MEKPLNEKTKNERIDINQRADLFKIIGLYVKAVKCIMEKRADGRGRHSGEFQQGIFLSSIVIFRLRS